MQDRHPQLDIALNRDCFDALDAVFCDDASDEQFASLEQLLRDNETVRATAVRYMHLHALIERGMAETSPTDAGIRLAGPHDIGSDLSKTRATITGVASVFKRPIVWSVLAASVLFAGYVVVISWNMLSRDRSLPGFNNGAIVATIRETSDVEWSADPSPLGPQPAEITASQPLSIQSGLVELQLKQGTTLLIEGPADWKIDGENSATLTHGKLVAKVPQQAIGFTLETPNAKIIDLGTEFVVEVSKEGAADVHVVQGQISVQDTGGSGRRGPNTLQAGQRVRITDTGSQFESSPALPEKFQRLVEAGNKGVSKGATSSITRLVDLSHGAVASQSSDFDKAKYSADKAIDGNPGTFSHTEGSDAAPWWQVDLGSSHPIAAVVLQNRQDGSKSRLRDITVKVLGDDGVTVVAESPILNPGNETSGGMTNPQLGPAELTFDLMKATGQPAVGRFVRVERTPDEHDDFTAKDGLQAYVSLAEVQVFEVPNSRLTAPSPPSAK